MIFANLVKYYLKIVRPENERLFAKERARLALLEKEEEQLRKELEFVQKEKEKLMGNKSYQAKQINNYQDYKTTKQMNTLDIVVEEYVKKNQNEIDRIFKKRNKTFIQQGPFLFKDGSTYKGGIQNNLRHGFGTLISNDGKYFYSGNWEQGERKGECVIVDFCGRVYINHDVNGYVTDQNNFNGYGVYKWADGQVYKGTFLNGKEEGIGEHSFPNGERYHGYFKNGEYNGKGIYENPGVEIYEGEWENGMKNGKGKLDILFGEGDYYEGEFYNDEIHGKGKYIWSDGRSFEGNWVGGKMDGYGIMKYPNGNIRKGTWKGGWYVGDIQANNNNFQEII